ncbi:hypothetical protein LTR53_017452 [Teratosphaeriaceae sp. CCFEE 6253]|nr:hypothetical protein LTR53_017452 [Teratosphaeriaceae sp. CCFEE 6253]
MFGIVISGRPVDANPQAISETQYAFRVAPAPPFTSLVVFILPGAPFPPNTAASVYVQIPPGDFQLVGAIGPGKDSAIYKLNRAAIETAVATAANDAAIIVGLSIEPVAQVEAQIVQMKTALSTQVSALTAPAAAANPADVKVLAQKIGRNAFNYLSSYGTEMVPLKAFQVWWTKFEHKLELDPTFLDRELG